MTAEKRTEELSKGMNRNMRPDDGKGRKKMRVDESNDKKIKEEDQGDQSYAALNRR